MSRGRVLMLQGTASSVGKSLLVTALCRILRQDGLSVAPFKAQNMSNNSYVTADGCELGRAQAVQAEAAGIEPLAEMNPVLLKPEAEQRSQVVVLGRPCGTLRGAEFLERKRELWPAVTASLDALRERFDVIVLEGAGSPAEINLRAGDIVNMRVARYAESPVLLVGDIDRGGVFAHLVGTLQLLEEDERRLVRALVINKFRGTPALLQPGLDWLVSYTGLPVAGVVPWLPDVGIADEDAVVLEDKEMEDARMADGMLNIAVVRLPHVANFDDFDPLSAEPDVAVRYVSRPEQLAGSDLIVLPGTKSTIADLAWLRRTGIGPVLCRYAAAGVPIIGICGGYQMLGTRVVDPDHVESDESGADGVEGLGLLRAVTAFEPEKATHRVRARVEAPAGLFGLARGSTLAGYEIHMGRTSSATPLLRIIERSGAACNDADGAVSEDGNVFGTYLHGLFENDGVRQALLARLRGGRGRTGAEVGAVRSWSREAAYDRLADHARAALDMRLIYALLGLS